MRLITLLLLMLFGMASAAHAQWEFSLDPPQGRDDEAMNLRVVSNNGCLLSNGISSIVRNGNTFTATIHTTDVIPPGGCLPEWLTPRLLPLGTFATGNYEIEVIVCVNAPVPCSTQATLSLSVFGSSGQRFTVPTLSGAVVIGLMFAVMVIGALSPRRT